MQFNGTNIAESIRGWQLCRHGYVKKGLKMMIFITKRGRGARGHFAAHNSNMGVSVK